MEEDQTEQPGEENGQEPKTEEEEEKEEGGGEKAEGDEESAEKDDEEEEKEERGQEAGRDEDQTIPNDKGHNPKVCMSESCCSHARCDEHRSCGLFVGVSVLKLIMLTGGGGAGSR